jgi:hypothetical protein
MSVRVIRPNRTDDRDARVGIGAGSLGA